MIKLALLGSEKKFAKAFSPNTSEECHFFMGVEMKYKKFRKLRNGGYFSIHTWLVAHFGNANKCENPDCKGKSKYYNWALKKGEKCQHKRENFMQLCISCHRFYDETEQSRLNKSKAKLKGRKVAQYKNGKLVALYDSVRYAAIAINKNNVESVRSSISGVLIGRRKAGRGFTWRYYEK